MSIKHKVVGETIKTIDAKYLPNDIGVTSWNDLNDKPFGEEIGKVALVENVSFQGLQLLGDYTLNQPIEDGHIYDIVINDILYPECVYVADSDPSVYGAMKIENDDGAIGYLYYMSEDDWFIEVFYGDDSGTVSIYSDGVVTKTIDPKYLPEIATAQPDWDETDEASPAFIKNKPDKNDALALVVETGLVSPVAASDGSIYTDENGVLFTL